MTCPYRRLNHFVVVSRVILVQTSARNDFQFWNILIENENIEFAFSCLKENICWVLQSFHTPGCYKLTFFVKMSDGRTPEQTDITTLICFTFFFICHEMYSWNSEDFHRWLLNSEMHSKPTQTSKMELSAAIGVNYCHGQLHLSCFTGFWMCH